MFSDKQLHILTAVQQLINEKGLVFTSVREIAKQANINVSMISYYFGSKDEMLEALFQYHIQKSKDNFLSKLYQISPELSAKIKMNILIEEFSQSIIQAKSFSDIVNQNYQIKKKIEPDLEEFHRVLIKEMTIVIEQGVEEGIFELKSEPAMIIANIIGTLFFIIRNSYYSELVWNLKLQENQAEIIEKVTAEIKFMIFSMLEKK